MSPHPRYNSQVLAFLSRQIGSIRDRTQELARYAKMVGRWTVEAVTFPFYKAIQERKILGQKVNKTVTQAIRLLAEVRQNRQEETVGKSSSSAVVRVINSIAISKIESTLTSADIISVSFKSNETATSLSGKFLQIARRFKSIVSLRQSPALPSSKAELSHQAQIQKIETLQIQGIASVLETKNLVLVTPEQVVLDVLSQEQQLAIQKRIVWEVASYYFHQRRKHHAQKRLGKVQQLLASLQAQTQRFALSSSPQEKDWSSQLKFLPQRLLSLVSKSKVPQNRPSLALKQKLDLNLGHLKSLPQAIANLLPRPKPQQLLAQTNPISPKPKTLSSLNVLKEKLAPVTGLITKAVIGAIASMPLVVIPAIAAEASAPPLPQKQEFKTGNEQWIDPSHLKTQLSLDELQGMIAHQEQSRTWLTYQPKAKQSTKHHQSLSEPRTTTASYSGIHEGEFGTEIRINAEFLGYETHVLEDILSWLDKIMVQVEVFFGYLWKWIGFAAILFLTGVENIRQRIWG